MGDLIEFHKPQSLSSKSSSIKSHPQSPSKEEFDSQANAEFLPRKVLEDVLEFADEIADVLIMVRGTDGTIGFVTSADGFESSLALIESVKFGMLLNNATNNGYNPGTGDTPPKGTA